MADTRGSHPVTRWSHRRSGTASKSYWRRLSVYIVDCNTCFGLTAGRSGDTSPATLLAEMGRHGVGGAWTYSLRGLHLADAGNTETLDVAAHHPSLTPVATIDPNQP